MPDARPSCFVVMGYKKRTDPDSSKLYDLDKSYRSIIKEAVEAAGYQPVRSDEVTEPGMISRQMYQLLMDAELVVCDLTTLNPNALFELGVRMALRPKATVVIAAEGTKIPFNLNQNRFFWYVHRGETIDYEEATEAQKKLTAACLAAKDSLQPDSLIYSIFRNELRPPSWVEKSSEPGRAIESPTAAPDAAFNIREAIVTLKGAKRWTDAIDKLRELHDEAGARGRPMDEWFTQQWALCTYKQRERDGKSDVDHLLEAREILQRLNPHSTTDAETLGLWAAIHKRLSEHPDRDSASRERDLATAIASYRKGYLLRDDHYNGVNYAFLLLRRAVESSGDPRRNVRDFVEATDAWTHVVELCSALLDKPVPGGQPLQRENRETLEEHFWQMASLAQALFALDDGRYAAARKRLSALYDLLGREEWMMETTDNQEGLLKKLLERRPPSAVAFSPVQATKSGAP